MNSKVEAVITDTLITDSSVVELYTYVVGGIFYTGASLGKPAKKVLATKKAIMPKHSENPLVHVVERRQSDHIQPRLVRETNKDLFVLNGRTLAKNPIYNYGAKKLIPLGVLAALLRGRLLQGEGLTAIVKSSSILRLPTPLDVKGTAMLDVSDMSVLNHVGIKYDTFLQKYSLNVG